MFVEPFEVSLLNQIHGSVQVQADSIVEITQPYDGVYKTSQRVLIKANQSVTAKDFRKSIP